MNAKEIFDLIVELSCRSFAAGTGGFITYKGLWQEIHGYETPFNLHVIMNDLGLALVQAAQTGAPAITSIVVTAPGEQLADQAKINVRNKWEQLKQPIDHDLERFIVDQTNRTLAFIRPLCKGAT